MQALALIGAAVVLVLLLLGSHWAVNHRHSHKTIRREAERWGWDERRKVHEIRAMKRRHGLKAKAKRLVRR